MNLHFEWDEHKDAINRKKHKITFTEAKTVFYDEHAILFYDENHSHNEDRYIILGFSESLHILVVCHCYIENKKTIRLISARKATKNEQKYYKTKVIE